ncbi:MAG TPA: hypothetical protein VKE51_32880 [Vicinamibacterales bacterium]|nr:hypothetical protein [Vicinamibacterales bacterium]
MGQPPSSDIWQRAEQAVVEDDASTLEALLRDHGDMLRTGPVQSTWRGGLAPDARMRAALGKGVP